ncbi:hypothetical protein M427DRAFT_43069 [Gonapodya prolifera JEL478]|uniref:Uncharacterized protein n=1 Tax=Gonapodya prolifera (strain JEL478) TaxID=1344416 RepID=A0A139ALM8_GONPJ|nr:hypothetical protein M427DRAFT_43069 [Gonapodya prolifera JEL478]|eukprot:KXS17413.1 hypothetical protein M427DRAFT_43069 [Gonapodya prolifera JEL478]
MGTAIKALDGVLFPNLEKVTFSLTKEESFEDLANALSEEDNWLSSPKRSLQTLTFVPTASDIPAVGKRLCQVTLGIARVALATDLRSFAEPDAKLDWVCGIRNESEEDEVMQIYRRYDGDSDDDNHWDDDWTGFDREAYLEGCGRVVTTCRRCGVPAGWKICGMDGCHNTYCPNDLPESCYAMRSFSPAVTTEARTTESGVNLMPVSPIARIAKRPTIVGVGTSAGRRRTTRRREARQKSSKEKDN